MHENREISCTSWSTGQDRSAKAMNRTADVNVQEKSDCAVVPVNQPNIIGEPSSAEAGEGRAQTKENIARSHMSPTQSGKRMSQGLHGVRQAPARINSHHPVASPAVQFGGALQAFATQVTPPLDAGPLQRASRNQKTNYRDIG
jgi:hypothetical protein